jgi:predicted small lipoprotein YifL
MLKKILLAFLLMALAGCGPLGLPSPSASATSSTDTQYQNDFSAMRCTSAANMTGC